MFGLYIFDEIRQIGDLKDKWWNIMIKERI